MWRFLLAGLATFGGLVLLFFGSVSDPVATVRDPHLSDSAAKSAVSRTETTPRAIAFDMNAPPASVAPPVHHDPVDHDGDNSAANTVFAEIDGAAAEAPPAPLRHAASAATVQRRRAVHAYVTRAQHQGVWLFPPDPTGGGSR
jgi:hypothetical protein